MTTKRGSLERQRSGVYLYSPQPVEHNSILPCACCSATPTSGASSSEADVILNLVETPEEADLTIEQVLAQIDAARVCSELSAVTNFNSMTKQRSLS